MVKSGKAGWQPPTTVKCKECLTIIAAIDPDDMELG